MLALIEVLTIINKGLPTIVGSGERLTKSGNDILKSKLLHHALEYAVVSLSISLTAFNVSLGLESKAKLGVFLITDTYVNILHKWLHDALSLLGCPQLLAEIEIDRHCHSMTLGSLACQTGELGSLVADGGGDTTPMEPVGTLHDSIEIEVGSICLSYRTAGAVVNNL